MLRRSIPIVILWVIVGSYLFSQAGSGWIPHDEGTLAHSAERVLQGELPHRDFDDVYTGGQAFLHAWAFSTLGLNLMSLRLVLLLFVLAWVPALYYIARRFVGPIGAAATVLLAVAWTVPNYPAAMPSWYNMFFATFGAAGVVRYLETRRRVWLLAAGVAAGLSCLFKIAGLYLVAGVLLFLAFHEQDVSKETSSEASRVSGRGVYRVFAVTSVLLFVVAVVALVGERLGFRELVHYVTPVSLLAALFLHREWTGHLDAGAPRFVALARLLTPFVAGLCLPIGLFLVPYLATASVGALAEGVFVIPMKRLVFAATRPPSLLATSVATMWLVAFVWASYLKGRLGTVAVGVGASIFVVLLPLAANVAVVYRLVWYSVRLLVPVVTLVGVVLMLRRDGRPNPTVDRGPVLLLLCVTAVTSLIQFPFSQPIYFTYVAPLVALTVLALTAPLGVRPGVQVALLSFYLLFAVLDNHGFIYSQGYYFARSDQTEIMALDRGRLKVSAEEMEEYEALVPLLRQHADGPFIYAAPDSPEVYFLADLRNPTRTLFDSFDEQTGRTRRILDQLERHDVRVVAINRRPAFSGQMPQSLARALIERFPQATEVGRFEVRWKN